MSLKVPPLGLAYLASAARRAGHHVKILDAAALSLSWREMYVEVRRMAPHLVGMTTLGPTADLALRAARMFRAHVRWIMVGGPHATVLGEAVFRDMPEVDLAMEGEAERSLPRALSWLETGAGADPPPGLRVRARPFQRAAVIEDLDDLDLPAWDLLPWKQYRYPMATRPGFVTMISSRGCSHGCTFCDRSVGGSRWRGRAAEAVLEEMSWLLGLTGAGFLCFFDDDFLHDPSRVAAICQGILERGLDLRWKCEGRVDRVDPHLLGLMKRAGCSMVAFGVESANASTLSLLGKEQDLGQVRRAFDLTRRAGIRTLAYAILGAPGETARDVMNTVELCQELKADYVQFSSLSPMPGSSLFIAATSGGGTTPAGYRCPGPASASLVGNPFDSDLHRVALTDLPESVLGTLLRKAWVSTYMRPGRAVRLVGDLLASGAWRDSGRMVLGMAGWLAPGLRGRIL